ncbi:MAG: DMT family transporter [Odoribacter sp.]|nr:DMT family transporter [Odoribacter sp.]
MTREKWKGHIAILTTNVIFGLNTPIAKTLVPNWISPAGLTVLRMTFATSIFWVISLFFKHEKVSRKDLITIFFAALFGLVGAQLSFAAALQYTSPVNISLLAAMIPVVVMLLAAVWLKEPITMQKAIGVGIGISGALLIILRTSSSVSGENAFLGNLLGMTNVITYSLYLVITRNISQRYTPFTLMKWMFLFSSLISLPLGCTDLFEAKIFTSASNINVLLRLAYVVIIATGVSYFLIPLALKRIRPTTVSMYNNAQPLIASSIAIWAGQDSFSWDKPIAAILVFIGVYLVTHSKSKEDLEKEKVISKHREGT